MCRNKRHQALVETLLMERMVDVSAADQTSSLFVSRASLIEQYGLEPDSIVFPRQPCKQDCMLSEVAEEEEAGEAGDDDDEGDEEGNEEEGDDVRDTDDLEDAPLATPVKKSVKRKQSGQKGKAKAKAR